MQRGVRTSCVFHAQLSGRLARLPRDHRRLVRKMEQHVVPVGILDPLSALRATIEALVGAFLDVAWGSGVRILSDLDRHLSPSTDRASCAVASSAP